MKFNSNQLIEDLLERTRKNINKAEDLKNREVSLLNWRSTKESWSVLECIEHLNLYGDYYLPECERVMELSHHISDKNFKSGWLGNYFAQSMLPKEKLNKMKTFKDKNPINSQLTKSTLDRFILQQQKTLDLLHIARNKNLGKIKTGISISKWIKLKLGDTFRVVIYHNDRHMVQIDNILQAALVA